MGALPRVRVHVLGIRQKFTRAYRPQTNSRAERFIQSALREWAYGYAYANSEPRCATWPLWNHRARLRLLAHAPLDSVVA